MVTTKLVTQSITKREQKKKRDASERLHKGAECGGVQEFLTTS